MTTIAPNLFTAPPTIAHDPHYRAPSLAEALAFQVNEAKRGVRMVALRDLPDHRLHDLIAASHWHMTRYGISTFRYRADCCALVLRARKAGEAPL